MDKWKVFTNDYPKFVLCSSLDKVEAVLAVKSEISTHYLSQLEQIIPQTGAHLITVDGSKVPNDLWIQDSTEIGRQCSLSEDGLVQVPAAIHGLRAKHNMENLECAPLDNAVARALEGMDVKIIHAAQPRTDSRWMDWFGNLEVSPPVRDMAGNDYPFGRVLVGVQNGVTMHPDVVTFLEKQGVQTPIVAVDTSWLMIGHVDEVISFVPALDRHGFRMLLPSPQLAESLLRSALEDGYNDTPVFAGTNQEMTVAGLLDKIASTNENAVIQRRIECIREQLCIELGLSSEDFIEIPVLFEHGGTLIPNGVNSLVCNGHILVPKPFGPVIEGLDIFETAVRTNLESLGNRVWFVDEWYSLHKRAGEVHCGTNAIRILNFD